ncbi:hypothetical protein HYFRA_00010905 [Hymenoscyphus fraxineus]|uniref:Uncharacterized protein n=1 Tax=Hymenoscyphus fraxineus TaxID=746836 RepID=A0A9N9PI46_9HELO|nr:hypothetical protein HYFRA_00010905 [Hymenoscyphus fraxineus]
MYYMSCGTFKGGNGARFLINLRRGFRYSGREPTNTDLLFGINLLISDEVREVLHSDPEMERILDENDDALEVSATDFSLFKRRFFTYYPNQEPAADDMYYMSCGTFKGGNGARFLINLRRGFRYSGREPTNTDLLFGINLLISDEVREVLHSDPEMERILDENDDALEVSATDFSLFKRRFFTYYPKLIGKFESYESLINMDHNLQPEPPVSVESTESPVEPAQLPAVEATESPVELPVQQTDQPCPMESTPICAVSAESPVSTPTSAESPELLACESLPAELPIQQTDQPCPMDSTPVCAVSAKPPVSIEAPEATTPAESLQLLACLPAVESTELTPTCAASPQLSACEYTKSPVPAESLQTLGLAVATALFYTLFSNRHVPVGMELLALLFRGGGGIETRI